MLSGYIDTYIQNRIYTVCLDSSGHLLILYYYYKAVPGLFIYYIEPSQLFYEIASLVLPSCIWEK